MTDKKRIMLLETEVESLKKSLKKISSPKDFSDKLAAIEKKIAVVAKTVETLDRDLNNIALKAVNNERNLEKLMEKLESAVTPEDLAQVRKYVNALVSGDNAKLANGIMSLMTQPVSEKKDKTKKSDKKGKGKKE